MTLMAAVPSFITCRSPRLMSLIKYPPKCPRRSISTSACLLAGHNKWSKIRHDKGAADRKHAAKAMTIAKLITNASRKGGPDYKKDNPALAAAVAVAKAANMTSGLIERAIARGQSRTLDGALEKMTIEAVMPGNVALILDVETDSRGRSLQDLNLAVKKAGGKSGSTLFYFEHCGRVVLDLEGSGGGEGERESEGNGKGADELADEVMNVVLEEEGVSDFEVEDGEATVWTEPASTTRVAEAVKEKLGLQAGSVDVVWRPRGDMMVGLESDRAAKELASFLASLHDFPEVNGTFMNATQGSVSDEAWAAVQDNLILP